MTRPQPFAAPGPMAQVLLNVQNFLTDFRIADDGPRVTSQLIALLSQVACAGKQVHDANIAATMQIWSVPYLLTNNVSDFARFGTYINVVPIAPPAPPASASSLPGVP